MLNTISYADINGSQMSSVISKIDNIDNTIINTGNLDIEEVDLSYVLKDNNWIAFYKNFMRELGGVKISYYDKNGNQIDKKYVLPKQFEGSSYEYERETVYVEDTLILRDTVNKYSIDLSGFEFSDNIPCFIEKPSDGNEVVTESDRDDDNNLYVAVNFNKWENCKNISEWLEDRANIQNLTNELGLSFEGVDDLNAWLGEYDAEYKSPGILIEPITFYPDSTEEIYCNDKNICRDYNLTHGFTSNRLEVKMKEYGNWN